MKNIDQRIEELVNETLAPLLIEKAKEAVKKLTAEEIAKFDNDNKPFRFPKVVLLAVVDKTDLLQKQIGSEGTKKEVASVKRILNKRY